MAYGTILKFDNDKYRVCFDFGKSNQGKRVRKYQIFDSKKEAEQAFNKHKVKMDEGIFVLPKNITFSEWLDYWLEHVIKQRVEGTTLYGYQGIIDRYLKEYLGSAKLQKLRSKDIQEYYSMLINEKKLSPNTVIKHHNLLTHTFKTAEKYEYINRNLMNAVEPPKKVKAEAKFYSTEQLGQLMSAVEGDRLEFIVKMCAYLGIRRGELCGLRWQDLDFEKRIIYIDNTRTSAGSAIIEKDTKTVSSNRKLHMPETLYQLLKKEQERQQRNKDFLGDAYHNSEYVCVMDDGKPYRPNYISDLFKDLLQKNNLPKIVLHELRNTFASLSNDANIPEFNIGKALGHAQPSTTKKIYTQRMLT